MIGYTELLLFLRQKSYQELDAVHRSGDFFVKGDTITWWPVTETSPFRYHYFDEELEKVDLRIDEKWTTTELRPDQIANQVNTEHGTIRPGEYIVHPFHVVDDLKYCLLL